MIKVIPKGNEYRVSWDSLGILYDQEFEWTYFPFKIWSIE